MHARTTLPGGFEGATRVGLRCLGAPARRPRLVALTLQVHPRFALAVTPTIPAGKPRRTLAARALAFIAWLAMVVRTASQRALGPFREISRRREALRVYRAPLIPA